MILVLIPLAGIMLGLGLWAALRSFGALNLPGADSSSGRARGAPWTSRQPREQREPAPRAWGPSSESYGTTGIRERIESLPQGCLLAVIITAGVWILGWLIVLVVGLSYLS